MMSINHSPPPSPAQTESRSATPESLSELARRLEQLFVRPPHDWTALDLQGVGVKAGTARVLIQHLERTPNLDVTAFLDTIRRTMSVEAVLDDLSRRLTPGFMPDEGAVGTSPCEAGDGTVIAMLLGQAIAFKDLAVLRREGGAGGEGFAQALLDLFMGRTESCVVGRANVAQALSIVLACGASFDTQTLGGVPPLIYTLCRSVPREVLGVLLRRGADPNEALTRDDVCRPACGFDYLRGGTAMHHAMLAGNADMVKQMYMSHDGRLDVLVDGKYDTIAVAGARANPLAWPITGLVEVASTAYDACIAVEPDPMLKRMNGEFLGEVLATRLLEAGRYATSRELKSWSGTMAKLRDLGCDVGAVLRRSPPHGGPSYLERIYSALWHFHDYASEQQVLSDRATIDASVDIRAWLESLFGEGGDEDIVEIDDTPPRHVMRSTTGPLFGDAPQDVMMHLVVQTPGP
ncbi:hypothetical protein PAQ31011_04314 [Pandoraea aquatica]|uniref:Uncharacterized protein n=1 Tax=Pandoraea aquatica TaxID=2508290 RepID=A0A5E4Y595_9BURK|nr:hypothetical protein [Pandoraea aquatica]VVE43836.1 hypothetical protein PAQ31011_04314 [Pandoraea aquatica]